MPKIDEILSDATPLDENDPEVQEELFPVLQDLGTKPEELPGTTERVRNAYRDWLRSH